MIKIKTKKVILIMLAILTIFSLKAYKSNIDKNETITGSHDNNKEYNENIEADVILEKDVSGNMTISIQVKEESFIAVLYDEVAAQGLFKAMPMTLNMEELNGNEKFCYIKDELPINAQSLEKINSGDIMLYGSNCLVIFYKEFSTPYNYTRIGYIENPSGLAEAVGKGPVEITLDKNN